MNLFNHLTSAIDCDDSDGIMSITLKNRKYFDYAMSKWSYINNDATSQFLMIADSENCTDDQQKTPYLITKVTPDAAKLNISLDAMVANLSDVAANFNLNITRQPTQGPLTGSYELEQTRSSGFAVPISASSDAVLLRDDDWELRCANCSVHGALNMSIDVVVSWFNITDVKFSVAPQNLQTLLSLHTNISVPTTPITSHSSIDLGSYPILGAGIEIAGIFSLGPRLGLEIGFDATVQGNADLNFGLNMTVPNTARASWQLQHEKNSTATGFTGLNATTVHPILNVSDFSAEIDVHAWVKSKVLLGFGLLAWPDAATVELDLILPNITTRIGATQMTGDYTASDGQAPEGVVSRGQTSLVPFAFLNITNKGSVEANMEVRGLEHHKWVLSNDVLPWTGEKREILASGNAMMNLSSAHSSATGSNWARPLGGTPETVETY